MIAARPTGPLRTHVLQFLYRRAARLPLPLAHAIGATIGALRVARAEPVHAPDALPHRALPAGARTPRAGAPRVPHAGGVGQDARRAADLLVGARGAGRRARARGAGRGRARAASRPRPGPDRSVAAPRCLELAGLDYSRRHPMVSMYRPQNDAWDDVMKRGRERFGARLVPSDRSGVRALLQALHEGGAVGVLPDQDPPRAAARSRRSSGSWRTRRCSRRASRAAPARSWSTCSPSG